MSSIITERRLATIEYLMGVVQQLAQPCDVDAVTAIVCDAARDLTGADGATFVLRDGDQCYYTDEKAISPLWKGRRFPLEACISGWVMDNACPVVIEDVYNDPRVPADAYRPTFVKSLAMVPIRRVSPIGAVGTYWAAHCRPTDEEVSVLQSLADTASIALANVRLEAKLHRTKQIEEDFISTVNHELRTPLASVVGALRIIVSGVVGSKPEQASRLIRIAYANAERLVTLTNDMTDIQAIQSGRIKFHLGPVDVRALAKRAGAEVRALSQSRGVLLRMRASQKCIVRADPNRLTQVVMNLLSNAIKFSPSGEEIVLMVDHTERHARISVRDHGPGIPEEFRSLIFERFVQVDASDSRNQGGMGLGLSIAKELTERLGGSITCSPARGGGTIFRIELPLYKGRRPSRPKRIRRESACCTTAGT